MKYAKIFDKGVLIKSFPFDGAKPFNDTPPEATEGMFAYPTGWVETETEIKREWEFAPSPDDIDDATAFEIIFGGAE